MHGYISRFLLSHLQRKIAAVPVVAILGPRQCGKSTLASMYIKERKDVVRLDLERPADLRKLDDPETFFTTNGDSLICIDEIQRKPELFPVLRYICDRDGAPGRFMILGSASRDLIRQSSESLAGRISYLELTPFLFTEISDQAALPVYQSRGGFPRSLLADSDLDSFEWRLDFIRNFIEREIPSLLPGLSPQTVERLLRMIAHSHGQLLNMSTFAGSLGIDNKTVRRYIDLLQGMFIIRLLEPYSGNLKKRLVKSPKIYIRDAGLLNALLGLPDWNTMTGHPVYGASWESLCVENIIARLRPGIRFSFYRTSNGAEIDLILEGGTERLAAEFKAGSAPRVERGLRNALDDLGISRAWVIAPLNGGFTGNGVNYSPLVSFLNDPINGDFFI